VFTAVPANGGCGTLTVPEKRSVPNGRTIDSRSRPLPAEAATPRPDPIVWLAGGPGDDGLTEIGFVVEGS